MLLIIIGFFIVGLFLSGVKIFKNFSPKYDMLYNYGVTIVATMIGVYAAIYISNVQEEIEKKSKASRLATITIDESNFYSERLKAYSTIIFRTSPGKAFSMCLKNRVLFENQVFNDLLSNESIRNSFTEESLYQLNNGVLNFKTAFNSFNESIDNQKNDSIIFSYIKEMIFWNDVMRQQLVWELKFQSDEISHDDLKDSIEIRYSRPMNESIKNSYIELHPNASTDSLNRLFQK